MSVMMKEDSSYLNNAVVSKSKASLFRELTCMVMQSSNYIKTLPEVDLDQVEAKKVYLPPCDKFEKADSVNQQGRVFRTYR